jgi:hypothetical protein
VMTNYTMRPDDDSTLFCIYTSLQQAGEQLRSEIDQTC